jgi:DNA-directed RNA polymerase specialized sigma24 family protein
MKPTYEVRAWRERGWWLARVVAASDGADASPVNALTHARTLTAVEQASRDLVATILGADERTFEIDLEYVLPAEVETAVCEAIGARTWLDAAQQLWRDHSAIAVHALVGEGFSLQDTAKLLGLSYQRVDQLLRSDADPGRLTA